MDFGITDHGSIWLIRPLTEAAQEWVDENVAVESWFGTAFAVEHRYAVDIVNGIVEAGFKLE